MTPPLFSSPFSSYFSPFIFPSHDPLTCYFPPHSFFNPPFFIFIFFIIFSFLFSLFVAHLLLFSLLFLFLPSLSLAKLPTNRKWLHKHFIFPCFSLLFYFLPFYLDNSYTSWTKLFYWQKMTTYTAHFPFMFSSPSFLLPINFLRDWFVHFCCRSRRYTKVLSLFSDGWVTWLEDGFINFPMSGVSTPRYQRIFHQDAIALVVLNRPSRVGAWPWRRARDRPPLGRRRLPKPAHQLQVAAGPWKWRQTYPPQHPWRCNYLIIL